MWVDVLDEGRCCCVWAVGVSLPPCPIWAFLFTSLGAPPAPSYVRVPVRGCLAWMHGRAASRPCGFVVLGSCNSFWGRIFEYGKPRSSHPRLPSSHQPTQMHGRPHPHNRTPTTRSTTADANQRTTCLVRVSISTPLCCVLPLRASIVDHRARPPRLLFGLALWRARGTRAATIWWSSVRKERVSL